MIKTGIDFYKKDLKEAIEKEDWKVSDRSFYSCKSQHYISNTGCRENVRGICH